MRPAESFTARLIMSPQTGCSRRTSASGDRRSPTLRGCSKWCSTVSEYDIRFCRYAPTDYFSSWPDHQPLQLWAQREPASTPCVYIILMMPENHTPQRVVS